MTTHNLDCIFRPSRIAVVGASDQPGSVGETLLANLAGAGFGGDIFPVNPKHAVVGGRPAFPDVGSLPAVPDLAVVATPADTVPAIVRQCGAAGIRGLVIISAGFREIGERGRAREAALAAAWRDCPGLRILGPNCLGVIVPGERLNASFAAGMPSDGRVAFASQSGALCTAVLDWAVQEGVGFSHFVSVGNMLDVGFADLIDYFGADPDNRSLILYIESIPNGPAFMRAARTYSRRLPIVVYKAGRFAQSAQAAASHTGALAGEDAVYDAAFDRAGVVRVRAYGDVFDCAELLARQRQVRGGRLAIVTNAGGPGVMATDALLAGGGQLATLSAATLAALDQALPHHWSHGNPVDVIGDATAERFGAALDAVLADTGVDAVAVLTAPQAMTQPTAIAETVARAAAGSAKPILAAWMGGVQMAEGIRRLNQAGVPTYDTPESAVGAFLYLALYARNQAFLAEEAGEEVEGGASRMLREEDVPPAALVADVSTIDLPADRGTHSTSRVADRDAVRSRFASVLAGPPGMLSESTSKEILAAYGIPVNETRTAATADAAVAAAVAVGYPVVLKVLSPQITHKTDVGGVVPDLAGADDVRRAFDAIVQRATAARPDASLDGVTVQPMIRRPDAAELILGAKHDPTFGPVILVGLGGVVAELLRDRALGLPPLGERDARRMLEALAGWPLLNGYRGRPAADVGALVETMMRFSRLVEDMPELREIDVNPLLVSPSGVLGLDARMRVAGVVEGEA